MFAICRTDSDSSCVFWRRDWRSYYQEAAANCGYSEVHVWYHSRQLPVRTLLHVHALRHATIRRRYFYTQFGRHALDATIHSNSIYRLEPDFTGSMQRTLRLLFIRLLSCLCEKWPTGTDFLQSLLRWLQKDVQFQFYRVIRV